MTTTASAPPAGQVRVDEVMTRDVAVLAPGATIAEIAKLLIARGISAAPVVGEDGELLGVVSEGDLIRRAELGTEKRQAWWLAALVDNLADPADAARGFVRTHGLVAREIMTSGAVTIHARAPLGDAAALMDAKRIKRLFVTDGARLVGVLTRADIVRALARRLAAPRPSRSDLAIRDEIAARIRATPWATSAWVSVTVADGVVDLIGGVESDPQREAIVVMARETAGVRAVHDHLVKRRIPSKTLY